MALEKIEMQLKAKLAELETKGFLKGDEKLITGIKDAEKGFGIRYYLKGYGKRAFLKMNSNSYLGLAMHPEVIAAETQAAEVFGTSPSAVRFISGSYELHQQLEQKLAVFHGRESAMLFSAAYAAVMGVLPQLIDAQTLVVSDALNHNSIINAIRLSHCGEKAVYPHLDIAALNEILKRHKGKFKRVCVITDGIFSMRGDYAPLDEINDVCQQYQDDYQEGVITIVDDSHGIGALGQTGRGTEEYTNTRADILLGTLGKSLGVNGGYVVASKTVTQYLRETSPFYIYSNPITASEAAAALKSLEILDSSVGVALLEKVQLLTKRFRAGLNDLGFEILEGEHPIVALLIRDTEKTAALVKLLFENNILVTGLNYPVVPESEQEIRLQVSASHTEKDIAYILEVLAAA
ncbi:MAG: aminotransferase class I/II-fold pyridoxal phosphate-dependent enzyme [Methylococcaceae bacterium]|nr:aminotransferase class I/II-fold pyridoxal phosphate-dependent enzyme [Methylococcaceae bacterium]